MSSESDLQEIRAFVARHPDARIMDVMAEFDLSDTEAFAALERLRQTPRRFMNWQAMTWAERRELLARPRSHARVIGPLCWHYCQPSDPAGKSAEWADQCGAVGCRCPCHRWGSDEYRRQ